MTVKRYDKKCARLVQEAAGVPYMTAFDGCASMRRGTPNSEHPRRAHWRSWRTTLSHSAFPWGELLACFAGSYLAGFMREAVKDIATWARLKRDRKRGSHALRR